MTLLSALLLAAVGSTAAVADVRWIGEDPAPAYNPAQTGLLGLREKAEPPLPKNTVRFRRIFDLPAGTIVSAEAKVCGLGFYELWANGRPVDPDRLLAPGWSRPEHRLLYDRYDLTQALRAGEANALGLWVSPGYSDDVMRWCWRWLKPKRAWLTLDVRYADGTARRIVTDGNWQWTDCTPIAEVSLYHGERYDATREDAAWACARGSTAAWRRVREIADEKPYALEENVGPAIRPYDPRPPAKTTFLGGNRWLLDFGVNRAGVVEMALDLPRGHVVTLRHAEEVSPDGRSLDCRTLRSARACDTYVFGGNGPVRHRPRFTYHGFRFVEVSGVPPEKMTPAAFRAWGVSADMPETATFVSSDPTLNWLFDSARRSIRSNAVSFPSDCPMRDERTPCLMDSNCAEDTAMLCFGLRDFYAKWLGDAARYEDGVRRALGDNDNPDWEGEPILLAERLLTQYAATNAVRREWGALKKVAEDFERRLPADGVWKTGFGDWCPPDGTDWKSYHASVGVVNTALLAAEWRAMARVARALGETADAVRYAALFARTTNDFAVAFLNRPGRVCGEDRQADLAVPLALDVVPAAARPAMLAALARRIRETDGGHIGTGIYGTRFLGDVLLANGLADLWWEVIHKTGYPGFETMRAAGATTLWEQWRADGGMNSHNHAMMSGAAACLLTHVAGFRVAGDGRARLVIRPVFPSALDWVRASLETPRGTVAVNWRRTAKGPFVEVSAPTGLDVSLDLPKGATGRVVQFDVRQVFRPERVTRGNVNLRPQQPLDKAAWIWVKGAEFRNGSSYPVVRFRNEFTSDGSPLTFDVTADPRYVLRLDGREISRGPHKGFPGHWYYQTYEVTGLRPGRHVLEATVFYMGDRGPLAILTNGSGAFVLKAEGFYDGWLTTGKSPWQGGLVSCMGYGRRTDPDTMTGAENIVTGTGFLDAEVTSWQKPHHVREPLRDREYGNRIRGHELFPTERPDELSLPRVAGGVRAAQETFGDTNRVYTAADVASPWTAKFDALVRRGEKVVVPAGREVRFIWDLEDYVCAFPQLETSGGRDAEIRWAWTESLYGTNLVGHLYLNKGDRGAFLGKRVVRAMYDTFRPDGRADARFTTPWWKCGRWIELSVRTADEPLELTRLGLVESRYPLEPTASFECDDPTIADVRRICMRGLQCCTHEMFMDCPYYEQQMYPGDTRVEMLVLNAIHGDDRLLRFGIGIFDYARRSDGMVPMNFPTTVNQDSATYSLCWATMVGDYALWHGTNAFLRARLPGMRHTLSAFEPYLNADGLLEDIPGWSFQDWVPEWDTYGNAPEGRRGVSAVNNLLYVYALRAGEQAERAFGDTAMAACWKAKADACARACVAAFWDESRGLMADTRAKDCFSEHAQCLALLADVLPADKATRAFAGLLAAPDLARCTVYFSHYLFDTYFRFARADLFLKRLDLWRGFVADDMKTPLEAPGWRGRSDCHAWGAHPLYHLQTGIAGVRPAAIGYEKVLVAPQPGGLRFVKATCPTPKGPVVVDLRFDGPKPSGTVTLPAGLTGDFEWQGVRTALKEGVNAM